MDDPRSLDEYITTSFEANILIAKELREITFLDRMEPIMTAVARRLVEAGADFSKVDLSKLQDMDSTATSR